MPNQKYQGFTLIEILVVMFIVGVMLLATSYSFSPKSDKNSVKTNIITLQNKLQYALDYATFNQQILALTVHETGYFFSDYHANNSTQTIIDKQATNTWQPLTNIPNLSSDNWQAKDKISHIGLILDGIDVVIEFLDNEEEEIPPPHIIIFPNYETNDFLLNILDNSGQEYSIDAKKINEFR